MPEDNENASFQEKRRRPRQIIEKYYSVEFEIPVKDARAVYQYKIRDISDHGMCLLVREDSAVLKHMKVGDEMRMKYWPEAASGPPRQVTTRVRHITKDKQGRFKGHYLVGLYIMVP